MRNTFNSKLLLYFMVVILLAFTSYRTIDLVSKTLPVGAALLAVVAVLAFDGGILVWARYFSHGAKSAEQVTVSSAMMGFDFIGTAILFIAHTLTYERLYVQSPQTIMMLGTITVWTVVFGVLANVGALLVCHLYDPDEKLKRAQRDAETEIDRVAVEMVQLRAKELAAKVAPAIAEEALAKARAGRERNVGLPEPEIMRSLPMPSVAHDVPAVEKIEQNEKRGRGRPPKSDPLA